MAQDELTVNIDSDLRTSGEALFKSLGMDFSSAVNVFVREAVTQGRIPFAVDDPGIDYDPEAPIDLEQLRADYKAGRVKSIPLEDVRREAYALHD